MEKVWLYASVAGILPALFWILFWMREDKETIPEPKILVIKTFIFGGVAAILSLAFEALIIQLEILKFGSENGVIIFAFIEEFLKFFIVYHIALKTNFNNERTDPVLYMIIGALGFAAVENIAYLIDYINNSLYIKSMIDGSYRFIGSTLLHTISSAFIGIVCALLFFKNTKLKLFFTLISLAIATIMHALFNFLVSSQNKFYENIAFYGSWISVVILLLIFEYLRRDWRVRPRTLVRIHFTEIKMKKTIIKK